MVNNSCHELSNEENLNDFDPCSTLVDTWHKMSDSFEANVYFQRIETIQKILKKMKLCAVGLVYMTHLS